MPRVELKFTAPGANIRRFSADERLISLALLRRRMSGFNKRSAEFKRRCFKQASSYLNKFCLNIARITIISLGSSIRYGITKPLNTKSLILSSSKLFDLRNLYGIKPSSPARAKSSFLKFSAASSECSTINSTILLSCARNLLDWIIFNFSSPCLAPRSRLDRRLRMILNLHPFRFLSRRNFRRI